MTEQTAPGLDGYQIDPPRSIDLQQRQVEAGQPGRAALRDRYAHRPARGPDAAPARSHRGYADDARIIAAADEARRRIERDLHDGLQQRLVSLGLQARLAEASVSRGQPELKRDLARIVAGLMEALESVREISRGIHPAILSEAGLGPAVKALARSSPVPMRLQSSMAGRLPDRVEAGAYYIISEALANAAKHAKATVVDVSISQRGNALHLSVRDDGIGGADRNGPGLTGLAGRVHALAGTMRLVSPPGDGTHLRVRLPISQGQQVRAGSASWSWSASWCMRCQSAGSAAARVAMRHQPERKSSSAAKSTTGAWVIASSSVSNAAMFAAGNTARTAVKVRSMCGRARSCRWTVITTPNLLPVAVCHPSLSSRPDRTRH